MTFDSTFTSSFLRYLILINSILSSQVGPPVENSLFFALGEQFMCIYNSKLPG